MSYIFCRVISKMMLGNIVQHALLVFTTLEILNSIGIVLSQDELEHGLATDCFDKSMRTQSLFQKIWKFINKVYCFLEYICGDKCIGFGSKCECGDTTFDIFDDAKYCCNQRNETCKKQGMFEKLSNVVLKKYWFHFTRASKDSIYFETRVRVFSGPTITSPSPDSSLNFYTDDYLFWAHVMKVMYKLLKLCSVRLRKSKKYSRAHKLRNKCLKQ